MQKILCPVNSWEAVVDLLPVHSESRGTITDKFDQLFKFLDYSLNSRDIALPQVVVFF